MSQTQASVSPYGRHNAAFRAARHELDDALDSDRSSLPERERKSFDKCRTMMVPVSAAPVSLLFGLLTAAATKTFAPAGSLVARMRKPLGVAVAALHFAFANRRDSTFCDPCYMHTFAGPSAAASRMRDAYRRVYPAAAFLAAADELAAKLQMQQALADAGTAEKGGAPMLVLDLKQRLSAIVPLIPSPEARTEVVVPDVSSLRGSSLPQGVAITVQHTATATANNAPSASATAAPVSARSSSQAPAPSSASRRRAEGAGGSGGQEEEEEVAAAVLSSSMQFGQAEGRELQMHEEESNAGEDSWFPEEEGDPYAHPGASHSAAAAGAVRKGRAAATRDSTHGDQGGYSFDLYGNGNGSSSSSRNSSSSAGRGGASSSSSSSSSSSPPKAHKGEDPLQDAYADSGWTVDDDHSNSISDGFGSDSGSGSGSGGVSESPSAAAKRERDKQRRGVISGASGSGSAGTSSDSKSSSGSSGVQAHELPSYEVRRLRREALQRGEQVRW